MQNVLSVVVVGSYLCLCCSFIYGIGTKRAPVWKRSQPPVDSNGGLWWLQWQPRGERHRVLWLAPYAFLWWQYLVTLFLSVAIVSIYIYISCVIIYHRIFYVLIIMSLIQVSAAAFKKEVLVAYKDLQAYQEQNEMHWLIILNAQIVIYPHLKNRLYVLYYITQ